MIWQNPWAWAGLGFVVLPVLIHLLGRGQAPRRVFPTLRFLPPSRALPTRRRRIRDPLLLAARIGILVSAVMALAQPFFVTSARRRDSARGMARAIIVDTSASMRRGGDGAARPLDSARVVAAVLARESQTSLVIETGAPRRAVAGAIDWSARQRRRAEVVIVSDFQAGTLDAHDVAAVPRRIGLRLSRVPFVPVSNAPIAATRDSGAGSSILILAGIAERDGAAAAQRAAALLGVHAPIDSSHSVAIVYVGYERRAEMLVNARSLGSPWMSSLVARLRADSTLIVAASSEPVSVASSADTVGRLVVTRTDSGRPAVVAVQGQFDGRDRLILLPFVNASSLTSAALIAATTRALSDATPVTELEPTVVSDDVLRSWQREPDAGATSVAGEDGASDGRWMWIITLALLGLETWLRRARREAVVANVVHDRAA